MDTCDLTHLLNTITQLRGENGCPWDKKQTPATLKKYLQEECAEIIAAIDKDDPHNLCEELGDFLYLILMIAEISREDGGFGIAEVINSCREKLIRRHPHVFTSVRTLDEHELRQQWSEIKRLEKNQRKNY